MNIEEIKKLSRYIEENTRADSVSGIEFIDPRNFRSKVSGKQNYVVFGRRGAGKSTLLKTLLSNNDNFAVYVNLEDYKDITFPNIIIKILIRFYEGSIKNLNKEISFWHFNKYFKKRKLCIDLEKLLKELKTKLNSPDDLDEKRKYISKKLESGYTKAKASAHKTSLEAKGKYSEEDEIEHQWKIDKLNDLKTSIDDNKDLIYRIAALCEKQVILIFDDFYFIPKDIQPYLVDYFHRLTKSNNFYLKIGTVKHRSFLYKQTSQSYIGMELNADVYDIDLDYTLDKWSELKRFNRELLEKAIESSSAKVDLNEIVNDQAFDQLCIASGGVPRDL